MSGAGSAFLEGVIAPSCIYAVVCRLTLFLRSDVKRNLLQRGLLPHSVNAIDPGVRTLLESATWGRPDPRARQQSESGQHTARVLLALVEGEEVYRDTELD
jgi:hypothetical protein